MMRKFGAWAGAAALVLVATGCGTDDGGADDAGAGNGNGTATAGAETGEVGSIAAVIKGLDNPFFGAMRDGIDDRSGDREVEVEVQAAQSLDDTTGQADRLTTLAGQDHACFIVNPISETNLVQPLAEVAQRDVPVVNIDLPISPDAAEQVGADIATYIGTDNVAAGRLGGEFVDEQLGGEGQVALIGGIEGDPTSAARLDGFQEGIGDGIEIITTQPGDWDRQTALTAAETIINANPDVAAFFAANDVMALGISQAVANAGRDGEIIVVGVDGIEDALDAVAEGNLTATVSQYPYVIGQMGVDACLAALEGRDLPEEVDAPVQLVTAENAETAQENFPEPPEDYDNPFVD
jgi:ABC-type sugar transport system substrate-binding protein